MHKHTHTHAHGQMHARAHTLILQLLMHVPGIYTPAMVHHGGSPKTFLGTSIVLSSLCLHNQSSIGCMKAYVLC